MTSSAPKVGIIYLTYPTQNWERDITRFMKSLERIDYPKDRLELICVESKGKLDPIKGWFHDRYMRKSGLDYPRITYIFNDEWIGFSGNNNLGYAKAKELGCDYIHLTNEDTDIEPDYIRRAVERAESDPNIAVVQSLLLLGEERDKINSAGNEYHYLGFGYSKGYGEPVGAYRDAPLHEIGYASGAAMLCRVSAFEKLGGLFDERFFSYHEDTDASLKARLAGWKIVIEPSSVVYHYYEFGKSKKNFFWMERNRYVLVFSYYKLWTLFVLWPMLCVMDAALLLFSIKNSWWREKLDVYREWFTLSYWKWIRSRRAFLKSIRTMGDRKFLKIAVPEIKFQGEGVRNPVLEYIGNPIMKIYWWVVKRLLV